MVNMRRQLLGLGVVAASSLLAINSAHALNGPTAIQIDGGPLGPLEVSGGLDGYGFFQTGGSAASGNNVLNNYGYTNRSNGFNVGSALIELQKTTGVLQFTVEVGSNGGTTTLGARPIQTSINQYSTGPLYAGYVTIAPKGSPVTISAGQMVSLEGYEGATDWNNPVQLTTALFGVENLNSRGVSVNFTKGPINATVMYGDGYNTGVFNFLQALFTYTINGSNTLNVYYGGNLGQTGLNAKTYGGTCGYGSVNAAAGCFGTVGSYGAQFDNSQMVGAYYSYTTGNLNLVPEVQYQVAKANAKLGLYKQSSNFGAALFSTYTFGKSPYSLGSWVEYYDEHNSGTNSNYFFLGQNAEAIGLAVAPTWQYKDLFARANAGYIYLLNNKGPNGTYGYGNGDVRGEFTGTLEAGVLF